MTPSLMLVQNIFSFFAAAPPGCGSTFLGFQPWYAYLPSTDFAGGVCQITSFTFLGAHSDFILILLAIVDDLFRLVGILAVGFIIFAGFKYITSQGEPAETAKALSTAINALIGLGIALVAIRFVAFLGTQAGDGSGGNAGGLDLTPLPNTAGVATGTALQTALSVVFPILGAVAFMIIVIAGLKYTLSQGDPQATAKAKNAIIYALVGLVLAIVAQSIVSLTLKGAP